MGVRLPPKGKLLRGLPVGAVTFSFMSGKMAAHLKPAFRLGDQPLEPPGQIHLRARTPSGCAEEAAEAGT